MAAPSFERMRRLRAILGLFLAGALAVGCGDGESNSTATTQASSSSSGGGGSSSTSSSGGGGSTASGGAGGQGGDAVGDYSVETSVITTDHRFIDGQMFGGWGPHLGHLVRSGPSASGDLWFVDDVCSQGGGALAACDVLHDHTLGYYRLAPGGWELAANVPLPGTLQQNTATIASADGATLTTFGIDVASWAVVACDFDVAAGPAGCATLSLAMAPGSNYVGAAVSPQGYRLVWWTTVVDGGGGSFHYGIDYGGGWNGPRSGPIGGYNDASYVNVAFAPGAQTFTMHAEMVSGLAPNWTFTAGVGEADMSTADPVTWSVPLADPPNDRASTTNDVWIDPASGDTHLLARTDAGSVAYYHRPSNGAWSAPLFTIASALRARFVPHGDRLAMLAGSSTEGLLSYVARPQDRPAGQPIAWESLVPQHVALPAGYEQIFAIYPCAPPYTVTPATAIDVALVGQAVQNEVLAVHLAPP